MRFLILFLLVTFAFSHFANGNLDKEDKDYIKHKKVIKVCINPDWSPIEFREHNKPQGISIDILKKISTKIGLKLDFIYTRTWQESQNFLKEGKCDITPTAVKTPRREKYAIFTKPYLKYDLAIITSEDKPYFTDISGIIDKTLTRKMGSGIIVKLRKLYSDVRIIETEDYETMFELVNNDKAYATIATLPVFAYYKKRYNLHSLKIAGFTGWKYNLRIMVNKNEPKLREILDMELNLISPKTTQQIYEKWIVKTKAKFDYKQFFISLSIVLVIIIIFSIWIYMLHKKNKTLHKLSQVKSQFLANMSHELRTPLNSLIGFIQILKQNPKPEECKKYLPLIDSSSQVILTEIDDILNFDRLQKDIKIENKEFTSEEIKNIVLFCKLEAQKKNLNCIINLDLPNYLKGDIDKIRDVLIHLLDNALKFTEEGSIEVNVSYKNDKLLISIKDTGIGIDNKDLKKIFKEFVQLDFNLDKKYKGIGLGLSIAQKLVKALGGELKVKSTINKGSEFYFEIPINKIEKKDKKSYIKDTILVVEDNKANQMFMKVILKQLNISFVIAENGKEAFEMYKSYHYPIILMDINMPIMDGIEATKKIREYEIKNNLKHSKIIAVTANAIDGDEEKFMRIGLDGYITKPVNIDKLIKFLIV